MYTLVYGDDLFDFQTLANEMFQHRRKQFHDDFGWDLKIDDQGREIDEYDLLNPLYVILKDDKGHHVASGRLMPTTGKTMIADHFSDLTDGVEIESPLIWEVTRVFVANRDKNSIRNAAALMWAGCQIGLRSGVEFYVGVISAHMLRVFAACGWPAEVIGRRGEGTDQEICACLWEINDDVCEALARKANINPGEIDLTVYRRRPTPKPAPMPALMTRAAEIPLEIKAH